MFSALEANCDQCDRLNDLIPLSHPSVRVFIVPVQGENEHLSVSSDLKRAPRSMQHHDGLCVLFSSPLQGTVLVCVKCFSGAWGMSLGVKTDAW